MSETDDVLLGREELERAFTALGERLAARGVVADVFVVGGAAMALAYDAQRVTRDVTRVPAITAWPCITRRSVQIISSCSDVTSSVCPARSMDATRR